jgi:hypothetical protein
VPGFDGQQIWIPPPRDPSAPGPWSCVAERVAVPFGTSYLNAVPLFGVGVNSQDSLAEKRGFFPPRDCNLTQPLGIGTDRFALFLNTAFRGSNQGDAGYLTLQIRAGVAPGITATVWRGTFFRDGWSLLNNGGQIVQVSGVLATWWEVWGCVTAGAGAATAGFDVVMSALLDRCGESTYVALHDANTTTTAGVYPVP